MNGFFSAVLLVSCILSASAQKETFGGGSKSNFKDFDADGVEAFKNEMESMQEWWCIEKKHIGNKLCDSYGKVL
jgi:hypothetical protein